MAEEDRPAGHAYKRSLPALYVAMQVEVLPAAREIPVSHRSGNIRIGNEVSFLGEYLISFRYVGLPQLSLLV